MRNTDPLEFFADHRDTILHWAGISAAALAFFLILRFFAMRLGGWKAATRRLGREIALTGYAFGGPVRVWLRYRRSVRLLVARLGAGTTWRDAERALVAAKFAAAPGQPYAVVVGDDTVTVLLAAGDVPTPEGIWRPLAHDPRAWTATRAELPSVTPDAEGVRPIVVALGERDGECVFLDLAVGPPMVCVQGDPHSSPALFQAVAAQLDARLPGGQVVVADGVHHDISGLPVRDAYRSARARPPRLGLPTFLATPELPDPLPPELVEPAGDSPSLRVLLGGSGRGHVRTLLTDVHGRVAVPGTPLVLSCSALAEALARVLPGIPPVLPPAPAPVSRSGAGSIEWFAEEESGNEAAAVQPGTAQPATALPAATVEPADTPAAVSARSAVAEPPARSSGGSAASSTARPSARSTPAGSPGLAAEPEPVPTVGEPRPGVSARTSTTTPSSEQDPHASPAVSARRQPPSGARSAADPDPTPHADPPATEPDPAPEPAPTADTGSPPRVGPEPSSPGPR
ncbi:hypothetical protein [Embleya sp. NPDC020886]|uniref:hypothetical protein n=1 Tax=Embleya sp. NPDC020886 TaxID=3363980 RepID=UPI0037A0AF94